MTSTVSISELKDQKVEPFNGLNFLKSKQGMLRAARSLNLREVADMIEGTFKPPGSILAPLHLQRTTIYTFIEDIEPYVIYTEKRKDWIARYRAVNPQPSPKDPVAIEQSRRAESEALLRDIGPAYFEPTTTLDKVFELTGVAEADRIIEPIYLDKTLMRDFKFQLSMAKSYIFTIETQIKSAHAAIEARKLRIQHQCNAFFCNLPGHSAWLGHSSSPADHRNEVYAEGEGRGDAHQEPSEVPLADFKTQLFEYLEELRAMGFEPPDDQLVVTIATQILQHYHWDPIKQFVGGMLSDETDPSHIPLPASIGDLFIGLEGKIEHWIRQQLASGNSSLAHNTNLSYKRSPQSSAQERVSATFKPHIKPPGGGGDASHRECNFCGKARHTIEYCRQVPQELRKSITEAKEKFRSNNSGGKAAKATDASATVSFKLKERPPTPTPLIAATSGPRPKRQPGKKQRASMVLDNVDLTAEEIEEAMFKYMLKVNMLSINKLQHLDMVLIDEGANIAVVPDDTLLIGATRSTGRLAGFADGLSAKTTGYGRIPYMGKAAIVPQSNYILPKDSLERQGWFFRPHYQGSITIGYTAEKDGVFFQCTKDLSQRLIYAKLEDLKRAIHQLVDRDPRTKKTVNAYFTRGQARRQASESGIPGRTVLNDPRDPLDTPEDPATSPGSPFQGRAEDAAESPTEDQSLRTPGILPVSPLLLRETTSNPQVPPLAQDVTPATTAVPAHTATTPMVTQDVPAEVRVARPPELNTREHERAQEVVSLHNALNHMPYDHIKVLLSRGSILNCRLVPGDVDNAIKLFKHCRHCLAGKMRQPGATTWEIPTGAKPGQYWEIDLMFAHRDQTKNKYPIAIMVESITFYALCYNMPNKSKSSFIAVGKKFASFLSANYYRYGERPDVHLRSDREFNYNDLCDQVPGCTLHMVPNGMHAYLVERRIGLIKEAFMAKCCELPYTLPGALHPALIAHIVATSNYAPNSRLGNTSPAEALLGTKVELSDILRWNFGSIVYCKKPKDPNTATDPDHLPERGDHAIVIGFERQTPRNVKVMLLHNGEIVSRAKLQSATIDETIRAQITRLRGDSGTAAPDAVSGPVTYAELRAKLTGAIFEDSEGDLNLSLEDASASHLSYSPTSHTISTITADMIDESNMTIPEATVLFGREAVLQSVAAELKMTIDKYQIYRWVRPEHVEADAHIIPSKDFLKAKYANGKFNKLKTRTAAGGHRQRPGSFTETSSPTVDFHNVLLITSLAKHYRGKLRTTDFPSAYLNAPLKEKIVMVFTKAMSDTIVELYPNLKQYLGADGRLRAYLTKALYGLKQAGALWFKTLVDALVELGLSQSRTDACIFYKRDGTKIIILCFHVDDLLCMCNYDAWYAMVAGGLDKKFGPLQWTDQLFEYLAARFIQNQDYSVDVDMEVATQRFMQRRKITAESRMPSNMELFSKLDPPNSYEHQASDFKSQLYELMFLTRVRFDIIKECCFLATLADNPGDLAYQKLHKLQAYLNKTANMHLHLGSDSLNVHVFGDAAHAIHEDSRSHTGLCVYVGDPAKTGAILAKSSKQKIFAKSSHEAEVASAVDAIKPSLALAKLVSELSGQPLKLTLWQDNEAAIKTLLAGEGVHPRTRHYLIRWHFIQFLVHRSILEIKFVGTADMKADYLTKPQGGAKALDGINGLEHPREKNRRRPTSKI